MAQADSAVQPAFSFRPPSRIRITVRCKATGGWQFALDVDPCCTVFDVKTLASEKLLERGCTVPADQLRLMVKGRILGDSVILRDGSVVQGSTVFLVKGASASCIADLYPELRLSESKEDPAEIEVDDEPDEGEEETTAASSDSPDEGPTTEPPQEQQDTGRCWACRKKIGLSGIRCRCGYVFCSKHRYAEDHECTFDHQEFHRLELAKTVEGCVAEKLNKA
mmetsp:Transcript_49016/g.106758  ORF Transcript_49016/g.106758 Transcript_49016/m.106758 type:complete len:222 (-) Transcript_49016:260-925(-)